MTDLDDLRTAWEVHDRKLDESIRLNREVLRIQSLNRLRSPLRKFTSLLLFHLAVSLMGLALIGKFLAQHLTEARFVWPAGLLDIWLIFCVATSVRQLVEASRIDFNGPIIAIQRQLTQLRVLRIRIFRVALLTGQIAWGVPFLIVAFQMIWGVDAYRFISVNFIVTSLAIGVAAVPFAIWCTRAFGSKLEGTAFVKRLADEIAGRSLGELDHYLQSLREYERV